MQSDARRADGVRRERTCKATPAVRTACGVLTLFGEAVRASGKEKGHAKRLPPSAAVRTVCGALTLFGEAVRASRQCPSDQIGRPDRHAMRSPSGPCRPSQYELTCRAVGRALHRFSNDQWHGKVETGVGGSAWPRGQADPLSPRRLAVAQRTCRVKCRTIGIQR